MVISILSHIWMLTCSKHNIQCFSVKSLALSKGNNSAIISWYLLSSSRNKIADNSHNLLTIHFEQKQLISFPSLINVNYSMLLIDFNFHALLRMRRQVKMRYDIYRIEVLLRCTGTSASLLSFTVIPVSLCFMHDLPWISLVANVFSTIVYISRQFTKYQLNVLDFFSNLYMLLYLPVVSYSMPYQSTIFVSSL